MLAFSFTRCGRSHAEQHAAGVALRDAMLSASGADPGKIVILDGGKPVLDGGTCGFSVAHSENIASCCVNAPHCGFDAYAFYDVAAKGVNVGCDIECVSRQVSESRLRKIAEKKFSPDEKNLLSGLSGSAYSEMFFSIWTKKESYLKLTGEGLRGFSSADTCAPDSGLGFITAYFSEDGKRYIYSICYER